MSDAAAQTVVVRLGPKALAELREMYDADTNVLSQIKVSVTEQGIEGAAPGMRELVYLIRSDYDLELGFETVNRPLKVSMLNAASRIEQAYQAAAQQ